MKMRAPTRSCELLAIGYDVRATTSEPSFSSAGKGAVKLIVATSEPIIIVGGGGIFRAITLSTFCFFVME